MNKNSKRKIYALTLASIMGVASFSGCSKVVDCDIKEKHAHKYLNDSGVVMFVNSEEEIYKSHVRNNDYILIDKEEQKLREFEVSNCLYRIEENMDYINSIQNSKMDYIEYEYTYPYEYSITSFIYSGDVMVPIINYYTEVRKDWTTDPNHSDLTGKQKRVHHVYTGYKIERDEDGKLTVFPSEPVDNIENLPKEYKYIKLDFCNAIDAEYGYDLDIKYKDESDKLEKDEQTKVLK